MIQTLLAVTICFGNKYDDDESKGYSLRRF